MAETDLSAKPMAVWIAVFRGLNVGGGHKAPMAELRSLLAGLGLARVRTYIQSGNAVFEGRGKDQESLARQIEDAFEPAFGFRSAVALRTLAQWQAAMARCPFLDQIAEPRSVHVGFFGRAPDDERMAGLADIASGRDRFDWQGREIYLHTPDGLARSKLANALVSRNFGATLTLRNWRTVATLNDLARQPG